MKLLQSMHRANVLPPSSGPEYYKHFKTMIMSKQLTRATPQLHRQHKEEIAIGLTVCTKCFNALLL
jgi:hypothetical protein